MKRKKKRIQLTDADWGIGESRVPAPEPELLPAVRPQPIAKQEPVQLPIPADLVARGREYARGAVADSTRAQYRSKMRIFLRWCQEHGRQGLPADWETVRAFVSDLAAGGKAYQTIQQSLSAISQAHEAMKADDQKIENPCEHHKVRAAVKGIRRALATRPVAKKKAILADDLAKVVGAIGDEERPMVALRDRAILLLGFAGAFRRSELAALAVGDLSWERDGWLFIRLRKSKTRQLAGGPEELKAVPPSAAKTHQALRAWLEHWELAAAGPGFGTSNPPLFPSFWVDGLVKRGPTGPRPMSGRDVGRMVVRRLVRAGIIPPLRELKAKREKNPFGAHSLRAGFITQADMQGHGLPSIMKQSGHRSERVVLGYVRKEDLRRGNAAEGVAL